MMENRDREILLLALGYSARGQIEAERKRERGREDDDEMQEAKERWIVKGDEDRRRIGKLLKTER